MGPLQTREAMDLCWRVYTMHTFATLHVTTAGAGPQLLPSMIGHGSPLVLLCQTTGPGKHKPCDTCEPTALQRGGWGGGTP